VHINLLHRIRIAAIRWQRVRRRIRNTFCSKLHLVYVAARCATNCAGLARWRVHDTFVTGFRTRLRFPDCMAVTTEMLVAFAFSECLGNMTFSAVSLDVPEPVMIYASLLGGPLSPFTCTLIGITGSGIPPMSCSLTRLFRHE